MGALKFTMSPKATAKPSDQAIVPVVENLQSLLNADTAMFLKCYKAGADLEKIQTVVTNLDLAITNISKFGLTDQMMAVFNADGALEALCGGTEKLNQLVALEGLGQSIKEVLGKIVQWLRNLVARCVAYFNEKRAESFKAALVKVSEGQVQKCLSEITGKPGYEYVQGEYIVWTNKTEEDSCEPPSDLLTIAYQQFQRKIQPIIMECAKGIAGAQEHAQRSEDARDPQAMAESLKSAKDALTKLQNSVAETAATLEPGEDVSACKIHISVNDLISAISRYIEAGKKIAETAKDFTYAVEEWRKSDFSLCEEGTAKELNAIVSGLAAELMKSCKIFNKLVLWSSRGVTRCGKVANALVKTKL